MQEQEAHQGQQQNQWQVVQQWTLGPELVWTCSQMGLAAVLACLSGHQTLGHFHLWWGPSSWQMLCEGQLQAVVAQLCSKAVQPMC